MAMIVAAMVMTAVERTVRVRMAAVVVMMMVVMISDDDGSGGAGGAGED